MKISVLQGTINGPVLYVETQNPTSNANALITIEIGNGTVESGDFSTIDWSKGPYFIKTEIDPDAGNDYTITGTSQLLSVPYAFYAHTAENFSESDPVFNSSVAGGIATNDTSRWNNKPDTCIEKDPLFTASPASAIRVADTIQWNNKQDPLSAGTGIDISNNIISVTGGSSVGWSIGDFAYGGIVFWLDETGQHGLVCARNDQSTGIRWYAGTYGSTQAKGDGLFAGKLNTSVIIAAHVAIGDDGSTYAARVCNELKISVGGKTYGDWYLPSREELNIMFLCRTAIDSTAGANGGTVFSGAAYWSSTEQSGPYAYYVNFNDGQTYGILKTNNCFIRAVRAF